MQLSVSVLAGLSTSLRDDLVRCLVLRRPGLVAVVYDVQPEQGTTRLVRRLLDASGTVRRDDVELVGCCLSCTVRADAPEALELVAAGQRWRGALLVLPSGQEADTIAAVLADRHDLVVEAVTAVVDAVLLREQVAGDDLLADRGLAAAPADRRSTAELVVRQLEEADLLAVTGLERLATSAARTVQALLSHLAPLAVQVPIGPGGVGCDDLVGTHRRDPASTAADRERLSALAVGLCPPSCGVTTLLWQSERPLHSARLHAALPELIAGVVRSRGHIWLADRPRPRVRWESAGGSLAVGNAGRWHALPSCSLVLTGVDLDAAALTARLDACLATDAELASAAGWPDPFENALGPADRSSYS
jgi:G3E family GTPase